MPCYLNVVYGPTAEMVTPDPELNVILPTTGKPKLSMKAIYAEDNVTIKWYEYTLTIDALIYQPVAAPYNFATGDMEEEVHRIRKILGTPGLQLKMYPVGVGHMPTINGTAGIVGTDRTPDLSGGPFPLEVDVTPVVTNEAIHVQWTVVTRISHCVGYVKNLVSLVSDVDFEVNETGDISFVVTHTYVASTPIDITKLQPLAYGLQAVVGKSFQGMHTKHTIDLSPDQRTAVITVTASEIPSDNAFHPYTHAIEATDTVTSGLRKKGEGLHNWNRTISAKITLPQRVHKSWAWLVFQKILAERFRNLKQLGKDAPKVDGGATPNTAANPSTGKNWWLLLNMKMVDHIYSRTVEFQFDYLISTSLESFLSKSCIFNRVNTGFRRDGDTLVEIEAGTTPQPTLSDQWYVWQTTNGITYDGFLDYRPTAPITVAQCVYTEPSSLPSTKVRPTAIAPNETDPDETEASPGTSGKANQKIKVNEPKKLAENDKVIPPGISWVEYDNQFEILQRNDNIIASFLQAVNNEYYQDNNTNGVNRETTGFIINNRTSHPSGSYYFPEQINRGIATNLIRMRGYAMRVGHTIPTPTILSVGGNKVVRTGESRIVHKQVSPNENTPVYLAMWDITYAVVGGSVESGNIMATIESNGHPATYT